MATKLMKCLICNDLYVSWRERDNDEWSDHLRCRSSHKASMSLGSEQKSSMEALSSVDFVPKPVPPPRPPPKPEHKRFESVSVSSIDEPLTPLTPKPPPRRPPTTPQSPKARPRVEPTHQEMAGSLPAKFSLMTTDFAGVFTQTSIGVRQISAFKEFCARMARHEAKNARKLELIITEESAKIAKAAEGDHVVSFTQMWESVVVSLKQAVGDGLKASELIERDVMLPLETLEQKVTKSLKEIHVQSTKYEAEMKKSLSALAKSQEECTKAFAHISLPKETKESVARTPQYQAKWQTLKAQAKEHTAKAQDTLAIVDQYNNNLAECLDGLQELELLRLQFLTIHLERLLVIRRDLRGIEALDKAIEHVRSVNARTCLHMFIADWISDYGPLVKQPCPYALPLTPEQMDKSGFSTEDFRLSTTLEGKPHLDSR